MSDIYIKFLNDASKLYKIKKATLGSSGFDLVSISEKVIILQPSSSCLIQCGISLQMPKNFEAQVRPRSGLALKNMITVLNSPGTIDSDYRGEVCVVLINHGQEAFYIKKGLRVAQLVFSKLPNVNLIETTTLKKTKRGEGGFGSTGLN